MVKNTEKMPEMAKVLLRLVFRLLDTLSNHSSLKFILCAALQY